MSLHGRTAIAVDGGIATGAMMRVVLQAVANRKPGANRPRGAGRAPNTLKVLTAEADEVVCLLTPRDFFAAGSTAATSLRSLR